jgi:hypothetical protein
MLILTVREWIGPDHHREYPRGRPEVIERVRGMATRQPLGEAMLRLQAIGQAYKVRGPLAVEFSVLGVATIDDLTDAELEAGMIELIDDLEIPKPRSEDD